jgi:hypothetical protein
VLIEIKANPNLVAVPVSIIINFYSATSGFLMRADIMEKQFLLSL